MRKQRLLRMASESISDSRMGSPARHPKVTSIYTLDEKEDSYSPQNSPGSKTYMKRSDKRSERHHLLKRQDAEAAADTNSEEFEMEKRNNNKSD